jgi:hypothetical protein
MMFALGIFCGASTTYGILRGLLHDELGLHHMGILVFVIVAAVWSSMRDLGAHIPVPYLHRQVPEWFRSLFPVPVTSVLFGFMLGLGFVTKFTYGVHMTLLAVLATAVEPSNAIIALVLYSCLRTLNTFVGGRAESPGALAAALQRVRQKQWILRPASVVLSASLVSIALMSAT